MLNFIKDTLKEKASDNLINKIENHQNPKVRKVFYLANTLSGLKTKFIFIVIFISIILLGFLLSFIPNSLLNYNALGIQPRHFDFSSLFGVLMSWTMHADFNHLKNNLFILIQLLLLFIFLEKEVIKKLFLLIFLSGLFVWTFGSLNTIHIGASGLIFSLIGYMIASAIYQKRLFYIILLIVFSSEIYFVLLNGFNLGENINNNISLAGHLGGLITGFLYSFLSNKKI